MRLSMTPGSIPRLAALRHRKIEGPTDFANHLIGLLESARLLPWMDPRSGYWLYPNPFRGCPILGRINGFGR